MRDAIEDRAAASPKRAPVADDPAHPILHRYAVIACGAEWRILTAQRQFGHFRRRASAWLVAVGLAKAAEEVGHPVELCLQGDDGDLTFRRIYRSPDAAAGPDEGQ